MDASTTSDLAEGPPRPVARWANRVGVAVLFAVVLAGAVGLLGLRTDTVTASGGSYDLEVEHATITRAGQPAPLHLRVTHPGGFDGPVRIALCDDWFDDVDFQSWYPMPAAETGSASQLVYEFDPPPGETLEVSLDARTAPGQLGEIARCEIAVLVQDQPVVSAEFRTWRLP